MSFSNLNVFLTINCFAVSQFSCSATEILASFIAFAAASFPKASIYPDSSLISVTLTLINFNQFSLIQNQHFLKYFLEFISIRLISSIVIVAITKRN
jgi:hypothetical protein